MFLFADLRAVWQALIENLPIEYVSKLVPNP